MRPSLSTDGSIWDGARRPGIIEQVDPEPLAEGPCTPAARHHADCDDVGRIRCDRLPDRGRESHPTPRHPHPGVDDLAVVGRFSVAVWVIAAAVIVASYRDPNRPSRRLAQLLGCFGLVEVAAVLLAFSYVLLIPPD